MGFVAFYQKRGNCLRLLILCSVLTVHGAFADPPAEKITISLSNVSLETVFRNIQQQSSFRFIYTSESLEGTLPVSVSVKNVEIGQVLQICFTNQPVEYTIEDRFITVRRKTVREKIDITGTVLSESGDPLPGVTVSVKGEERATSSGPDGKFALPDLSANSVLVFSGINVETHEELLNGRHNIHVVLKRKVSSLDDVSVIVSNGYEKIPKERATGSFVQINNELFNQQVTTNVLDRLEAITSGLSVDRKTNAPSIMIRGLSTINGPKSPLIVVDNFPYDGDINNINPNDVANITVLRDAAAASIWGTKAGNGVIVITTKKGQFNEPLKIEMNANVTIAQKPDLFYLKQMSSSDFINVEQYLYGQGFYAPTLSDPNMLPVSPVVEMLNQAQNGQISHAMANSMIDSLRAHDVRNDFNKYVYGNPVNQQYSLSVQGGSQNSAWIVAGGLDRNLSELSAGYNRLNLRMEDIFRPVNNLQVTAGFYYTNSVSRNGKSGYFDVTTSNGAIPPYTRLANANGQPLPVINTYRQSYVDTAGAGQLLNWSYYPLDDYQHTDITSSIQDIKGNLDVNYKVIDGLRLDFKYQYENQQTNGRSLYEQDSYTARNLVNLFTQISDGQTTYIIPKGGLLDISNSSLVSQNLRGQLNFDKKWGNQNLAVLAGTEIRDARTTSNNYRTYGYNDDVATGGTVDFTHPYPTYVTGAPAFIPNNAGFGVLDNRFVSFFGNLAYTWLDKYIFSLSGRRDASNLFGVSTNNKWNPLWSAGISWEISKEKFFTNSIFPYLRFRATFGYSGNVDQSKSAVTTIDYQTNSPYTLSPYAVYLSYANPDLRWEKVQITNIGFDFSTKKIFSGSIEYYIKKGMDLFGLAVLDYTGGAGGTAIKNAAAMAAHGLDLELTSLNITGKFRWTTTLNLSYYTDKITAYYLPSQPASYYVGTTQPNISGVIGKPVYSVFSYPWAGLDPNTGDPQGILNGKVSKDYLSLTGTQVLQTNLVYNGPVLPTYFGSMGNHLSWKNISLDIRITYKLGYYFRRSSIDYNALYNGRRGHSDYTLRWQKPGDEKHTNVPSMEYPNDPARDFFYNGSEPTVEKGDNIRVQYITAAYDLTPAIGKNLPVKNLQFYVSASNPGILWKSNRQGIDPDYPDGALPPAKALAIGIKAIF